MKKNRARFSFILLLAFLFVSCKKELYVTTEGTLVPLTVKDDGLLPSVLINGALFHAETFGNSDSAMIVMMHGGPGSDYRYMLNCKQLADDGYFVVFYDQRGSGLSERFDAEKYSIQLYLDDISALIHHYKTSTNQKVFLFGHSWGAMLATAFINTYPEEIDGALLAEPGGFTWEQTQEYLDGSRPSSLFSETLNDAIYFDQFLTGDEHAILDYKLLLMASSDGAEGNPIGNEGPIPEWRPGSVVFNAMINIAENEGFDFTTNLDLYSTKILFAYSENNAAYGLQHALNVSSAFPNVQLELIHNTGHDMTAFPIGWSNLYNVALPYFNSLKY